MANSMRGGRQVRKARRALKKSSLEAGTYMSSYDKYDKAVKEKAFKKDWSTRKRVKAGDRLGVKLHMDTPAVYHGGKKKDSPSSVTQSDIGKDISNIDKSRWQNRYTVKGEYKKTIPFDGPAKTTYTPPVPRIPERPRTPPPEKETPDEFKIPRGRRGGFISQTGSKSRYTKRGGGLKSARRHGRRTDTFGFSRRGTGRTI